LIYVKYIFTLIVSFEIMAV